MRLLRTRTVTTSRRRGDLATATSGQCLVPFQPVAHAIGAENTGNRVHHGQYRYPCETSVRQYVNEIVILILVGISLLINWMKMLDDS